MIGVAVSMFTAVTVSRTILRLFVGTGLAQRASLFAPYQRKTNV
jgi:preprotein translocase subunit SecD